MITAGAQVTFSREDCLEGVRLGITRFVRDRLRGVEDQKCTRRYPWCENDIQGMLAEIAFARLAGLPFDRTTHVRAESGHFDNQLPSNLKVEVKWREGPPHFGDMIIPRSKAPYLRDRMDVACVLMHGRLPLHQAMMKRLGKSLGSNNGRPSADWKALLTRITDLAGRLVSKDLLPVTFTFRGWVWGDYTVRAEMWNPGLTVPGFLFEQRNLLKDLPLEEVPPRIPFEEVVAIRPAPLAPVDLAAL